MRIVYRLYRAIDHLLYEWYVKITSNYNYTAGANDQPCAIRAQAGADEVWNCHDVRA
jgi:hypothetical protein